ncbi:MAG TPA: hypothetical protein VER37_03845 [Thermomicrobiales bacterium]|nr:hypothetical protein [Thermomicrobiales bacterium]
MAFPESDDLLVFLLVVAARLLVPLAIPKWPLPTIVAALLLDAVDQTVFQTFTVLNLAGYQGYDKALDVYYLSIAYLSTFRNWADPAAFGISRFLFYDRLVGVALFEVTQIRLLLLIFPNTFEYVFIAYEAIRLRWNLRRLSSRQLLAIAAAIWILIKLPQEYWIHIARLDTTDLVKQRLFGVPVETAWGEVVAGNTAAVVGIGLALVLLAATVWWLAAARLPPADWPRSFDPDTHNHDVTPPQVRAAVLAHARRLFDGELVEKVALVSAVTVIFSQILPGVRASDLQLAVGVAVVVVANTALTEAMARSGVGWPSLALQFATSVVVNLGIVVAFDLVLLPFFGGRINLPTTLFFALLLTLLVTLYDRYQPFHAARLAAVRNATATAGHPAAGRAHALARAARARGDD